MLKTVKEFMSELFNAGVLSLIGYGAKKGYEYIKDYFFKQAAQFSLNDIWYSEHGNYKGEHIIEIIKFKQKSESIHMILKQYKQERSNVNVFYGKGILKADSISLYYFSVDKNQKQNGIAAFSIETYNVNDVYLMGSYYEINREKINEQGKYPLEEYKIYRLQTSFMDKIKFKFQIKEFSNYSVLNNYVKTKREKNEL